MGDEFVARAPHLVGVAIAGELEGPLERSAIYRRNRQGRSTAAIAVLDARLRRVELLDDREEIGEQLLVLYGCLRPSRYCLPSLKRAP
jgi:hypothetical protein